MPEGLQNSGRLVFLCSLFAIPTCPPQPQTGPLDSGLYYGQLAPVYRSVRDPRCFCASTLIFAVPMKCACAMRVTELRRPPNPSVSPLASTSFFPPFGRVGRYEIFIPCSGLICACMGAKKMRKPQKRSVFGGHAIIFPAVAGECHGDFRALSCLH